MALKDWYASPYARVGRRIAATAIAAGAVIIATKIDFSPARIVDSILALNKPDYIEAAKVSIGTAILMGLDKLKREWKNIVGDDPTDPLA